MLTWQLSIQSILLPYASQVRPIQNIQLEASKSPKLNQVSNAMAIRLQLPTWLLLALLVGVAFAQSPSTIEFTLYHQLVHSEFPQDIRPRAIISYDTSRNTAALTEQSETINFASAKGIYRIGLYDANANKKDLSPAAFTKLDNVKGPVTEEITLHFSSDNVLYHISYVLKPSTSQNTVVKVVSDRSIPEAPNPVLNAPVIVNPDGQPPVEEVEKTFLQKYWIYILPLLFILLTTGGAGGGNE